VSFTRDAREEVANFDARYVLARAITCLIPPLVGNRVRTRILRLSGLSIGFGTAIGGVFSVHGAGRPVRRVTIGRRCWINAGCVFDASYEITIGDGVAIGQDVMIITNTHVLGSSSYRAGPSIGEPVTVGAGTWIGARSTVLPGVNIGPGAIIAAGSLVNKSVPPNTLVAGVPAKFVRALDP
jgi:acetyltransferase-like isoleucine patch superfamily enzyme